MNIFNGEFKSIRWSDAFSLGATFRVRLIYFTTVKYYHKRRLSPWGKNMKFVNDDEG